VPILRNRYQSRSEGSRRLAVSDQLTGTPSSSHPQYKDGPISEPVIRKLCFDTVCTTDSHRSSCSHHGCHMRSGRRTSPGEPSMSHGSTNAAAIKPCVQNLDDPPHIAAGNVSACGIDPGFVASSSSDSSESSHSSNRCIANTLAQMSDLQQPHGIPLPPSPPFQSQECRCSVPLTTCASRHKAVSLLWDLEHGDAMQALRSGIVAASVLAKAESSRCKTERSFAHQKFLDPCNITLASFVVPQTKSDQSRKGPPAHSPVHSQTCVTEPPLVYKNKEQTIMAESKVSDSAHTSMDMPASASEAVALRDTSVYWTCDCSREPSALSSSPPESADNFCFMRSSCDKTSPTYTSGPFEVGWEGLCLSTHLESGCKAAPARRHPCFHNLATVSKVEPVEKYCAQNCGGRDVQSVGGPSSKTEVAPRDCSAKSAVNLRQEADANRLRSEGARGFMECFRCALKLETQYTYCRSPILLPRTG
jgi:hypothetical protein